MTEPNPIGPVEQLLKVAGVAMYLNWYEFTVKPAPQGAKAGRWCRETLEGNWTFKVDFGQVTFFIEDKKDAMFFKLAWFKPCEP